jgi:hypothetical protein
LQASGMEMTGEGWEHREVKSEGFVVVGAGGWGDKSEGFVLRKRDGVVGAGGWGGKSEGFVLL